MTLTTRRSRVFPADLEQSFGYDNLYDAFFEYTSKYKLVDVQNSSDEVARFLAWLFEDRENDGANGAVDGGTLSSTSEDEAEDEIEEIQEIEETEDGDVGRWTSATQAGPSQMDVSQRHLPQSHQQHCQQKDERMAYSQYFTQAGFTVPSATQLQPRVMSHLGASSSSSSSFSSLSSQIDFANAYVFGNASFRAKQKEIVQSALQGRNVFVLMPTGGGKSLCYQLPAVMSNGVTLVVTPLLSLMQDQVQALCTLACGGVPATFLSSQQTEKERNAVFNELRKEQPVIKVLFVTPEQLVAGERLKGVLKGLYERNMLARLVIDECHCVSQWGHDFRPEYTQIGAVKKMLFPRLPVTALTATATSQVKADVMKSLKIQNQVDQFTVSFFRKNLTMRVLPKDYEKDAAYDGMQGWEVRIAEYVKARRGDSGIVYCLSRDDAEAMACMLNSVAGVSASHYHAGMTPGQRTTVQNQWKRGEIKVVAATIAFGMGIDHPHVRYVIHATMSKSLEGYYQEAGRCGRDGVRGECILFYGKRDAPRLMNLIRLGSRKKGGSKKNTQTQYALLNSMTEYCISEAVCRHAQLLRYLGEEWEAGRCGSSCDVCLGEVERIADAEKKTARTKKTSGGSKKAGGGTKAATVCGGGSLAGDNSNRPSTSSGFGGFTTAMAAFGAGIPSKSSQGAKALTLAKAATKKKVTSTQASTFTSAAAFFTKKS